MNLGDILSHLPSNVRQTTNKLIKTHKKLAKCDNAVIFNGLCLKEDILPNFSDIYLSTGCAISLATWRHFMWYFTRNYSERKKWAGTCRMKRIVSNAMTRFCSVEKSFRYEGSKGCHRCSGKKQVHGWVNFENINHITRSEPHWLFHLVHPGG